MSEPLVVTIPHRLGKDEAARRIKDGIARAKAEFAYLLRIDNDTWEGDRLSLRRVGARPARARHHRRLRGRGAAGGDAAVAAREVRRRRAAGDRAAGAVDVGEEVNADF